MIEDHHRSRIAVVLATPPGFNAGMLACELALQQFLKRHQWSEQVKVFRLMHLRDRLPHLSTAELDLLENRANIGLACESLALNYDQFIDSKVILFWGDFLHMAQYHRAWSRKLAATVYETMPMLSEPEVMQTFFLLGDCDESVLGRTISFGTTLLFNTVEDESEDGYGRLLRRFVNGARRIWVRDAGSASRIAHLRNDYNTGYLGVDPALLLHDSEAPFVATAENPWLGYYFGRERDVGNKLFEIAKQLASSTGTDLQYIGWGDANAFPVSSNSTASLSESQPTIYQLLEQLRQCRLVVTDAYHLAVLAWNWGVPAVCAFSGHTTKAADVSSGAQFNWRDKREAFFSEYDALDFLIRPEELITPSLLVRRLHRIEQSLQNRSLCQKISKRIHNHAAIVESGLVAEMEDLLIAEPLQA